MIKTRQIIRETYNSEKFGKIRTLYNIEEDEVFFCARDVAKAFGYVNPSCSVRDICINPIKESHFTQGGLQVLNFITREDVVRLFKHSRSENCIECFFVIEAIADDFAERVYEEHINENGNGNNHNSDVKFDCFDDCDNCPYCDECKSDFDNEDDNTTSDSSDISKDNPFSRFVAEFVIKVTNLLNNDVSSIDSLILLKNGKPIYVTVKDEKADA